MHKLFVPFSNSRRKKPLELIFSYVRSLALVVSIEKYRYYILFKDDFSRFTWVYFLKLKSKLKTVFLQFKTLVENLF